MTLKSRLQFICCISALLFSCLASAAWQDVKPDLFDIENPPVDGSVEDQKDHEQLLFFQETRTKDQCDRARNQWVPSYDILFSRSGPLTKTEATRAKDLMKRVMALSEKVSSYYKKVFSKQRPYDRYSDIEPCVKKVGGNKSYPSSHATMGFSAACILAEIYPEKKSELMQHGQDIGDLRVISGLHHPTDVQAGQSLGRQICDYLKNQKDFLQEMEAIP